MEFSEIKKYSSCNVAAYISLPIVSNCEANPNMLMFGLASQLKTMMLCH